MYVHKTMVYII